MTKYIIKNVSPQKNGEIAKITVEKITDEDTVAENITVSSDMLFSLGILPKVLCEISGEKYKEIIYYGKIYRAVEKGIKILALSDNTAKTLTKKLQRYGIDKEIAQTATEYLVENGILNENLFAENYFLNAANTKLYGILRIKKEMYEKGFSKEAISKAEEKNLVDFVEICEKRAEKLKIYPPFSSFPEKKKAVQSLMRYGFLYGEITSAFENLIEKE